MVPAGQREQLANMTGNVSSVIMVASRALDLRLLQLLKTPPNTGLSLGVRRKRGSHGLLLATADIVFDDVVEALKALLHSEQIFEVVAR